MIDQRGKESSLWTLTKWQFICFTITKQMEQVETSIQQPKMIIKLEVPTKGPHYTYPIYICKVCIYIYILRRREREGLVWSNHHLSYTEHLKSKVVGQKDNHCLTKCGSIYHILCLEKVRQNHWRLEWHISCLYFHIYSWSKPFSSWSSPKAFPKRLQGHYVTVLKRSWEFRCIILENAGGPEFLMQLTRI